MDSDLLWCIWILISYVAWGSPVKIQQLKRTQQTTSKVFGHSDGSGKTNKEVPKGNNKGTKSAEFDSTDLPEDQSNDKSGNEAKDIRNEVSINGRLDKAQKPQQMNPNTSGAGVISESHGCLASIGGDDVPHSDLEEGEIHVEACSAACRKIVNPFPTKLGTGLLSNSSDMPNASICLVDHLLNPIVPLSLTPISTSPPAHLDFIPSPPMAGMLPLSDLIEDRDPQVSDLPSLQRDPTIVSE
ncbi:hypothetical protein NE237_022762 [Protea cynaroides]|uniref:Uncharacterized protein n=1 Tax=Protea cynaroides TaxID=273540 RepID=A0A9Q0K640_9MAGN|nr:hypothetical protein NE237_022762 [Protea cynaroides]